MATKEMCKCGRNEAESEHPCPYDEEMRYNEELEDLPRCTCCSDCQSTCSADI